MWKAPPGGVGGQGRKTPRWPQKVCRRDVFRAHTVHTQAGERNPTGAQVTMVRSDTQLVTMDSAAHPTQTAARGPAGHWAAGRGKSARAQGQGEGVRRPERRDGRPGVRPDSGTGALTRGHGWGFGTLIADYPPHTHPGQGNEVPAPGSATLGHAVRTGCRRRLRCPGHVHTARWRARRPHPQAPSKSGRPARARATGNRNPGSSRNPQSASSGDNFPRPRGGRAHTRGGAAPGP